MSRLFSTATRDQEFSEYVAARQIYLRRIAYAICGDWHQADDLLQTALAKLYLAWPRIHRDGREDAYARQIIVRTNIDEHRHRTRRPQTAELDAAERIASAAPMSPEDRSELVEALQQLPLMQRRVVVLRHWLDLTVAETATELGISTGTVKSHTARGMAALRRELSPGSPVADSPAAGSAPPQSSGSAVPVSGKVGIVSNP